MAILYGKKSSLKEQILKEGEVKYKGHIKNRLDDIYEELKSMNEDSHGIKRGNFAFHGSSSSITADKILSKYSKTIGDKIGSAVGGMFKRLDNRENMFSNKMNDVAEAFTKERSDKQLKFIMAGMATSLDQFVEFFWYNHQWLYNLKEFSKIAASAVMNLDTLFGLFKPQEKFTAYKSEYKVTKLNPMVNIFNVLAAMHKRQWFYVERHFPKYQEELFKILKGVDENKETAGLKSVGRHNAASLGGSINNAKDVVRAKSLIEIYKTLPSIADKYMENISKKIDFDTEAYGETYIQHYYRLSKEVGAKAFKFTKNILAFGSFGFLGPIAANIPGINNIPFIRKNSKLLKSGGLTGLVLSKLVSATGDWIARSTPIGKAVTDWWKNRALDKVENAEHDFIESRLEERLEAIKSEKEALKHVDDYHKEKIKEQEKYATKIGHYKMQEDKDKMLDYINTIGDALTPDDEIFILKNFGHVIHSAGSNLSDLFKEVLDAKAENAKVSNAKAKAAKGIIDLSDATMGDMWKAYFMDDTNFYLKRILETIISSGVGTGGGQGNKGVFNTAAGNVISLNNMSKDIEDYRKNLRNPFNVKKSDAMEKIKTELDKFDVDVTQVGVGAQKFLHYTRHFLKHPIESFSILKTWMDRQWTKFKGTSIGKVVDSLFSGVGKGIINIGGKAWTAAKSIFGFAKGGVVEGGKPVVGMVGEGKESEAIMPLSKFFTEVRGWFTTFVDKIVTKDKQVGEGIRNENIPEEQLAATKQLVENTQETNKLISEEDKTSVEVKMTAKEKVKNMWSSLMDATSNAFSFKSMRKYARYIFATSLTGITMLIKGDFKGIWKSFVNTLDDIWVRLYVYGDDFVKKIFGKDTVAKFSKFNEEAINIVRSSFKSVKTTTMKHLNSFTKESKGLWDSAEQSVSKLSKKLSDGGVVKRVSSFFTELPGKTFDLYYNVMHTSIPKLVDAVGAKTGSMFDGLSANTITFFEKYLGGKNPNSLMGIVKNGIVSLIDNFSFYWKQTFNVKAWSKMFGAMHDGLQSAMKAVFGEGKIGKTISSVVRKVFSWEFWDTQILNLFGFFEKTVFPSIFKWGSSAMTKISSVFAATTEVSTAVTKSFIKEISGKVPDLVRPAFSLIYSGLKFVVDELIKLGPKMLGFMKNIPEYLSKIGGSLKIGFTKFVGLFSETVMNRIFGFLPFVIDAFFARNKLKENDFTGFLGDVLFGSAKGGFINAISGALKWGGLAMAFGTIAGPAVIPLAILGGLIGYIGWENIPKFLAKAGKKVWAGTKWMLEKMVDLVGTIVKFVFWDAPIEIINFLWEYVIKVIPRLYVWAEGVILGVIDRLLEFIFEGVKFIFLSILDIPVLIVKAGKYLIDSALQIANYVIDFVFVTLPNAVFGFFVDVIDRAMVGAQGVAESSLTLGQKVLYFFKGLGLKLWDGVVYLFDIFLDGIGVGRALLGGDSKSFMGNIGDWFIDFGKEAISIMMEFMSTIGSIVWDTVTGLVSLVAKSTGYLLAWSIKALVGFIKAGGIIGILIDLGLMIADFIFLEIPGYLIKAAEWLIIDALGGSIDYMLVAISDGIESLWTSAMNYIFGDSKNNTTFMDHVYDLGAWAYDNFIKYLKMPFDAAFDAVIDLFGGISDEVMLFIDNITRLINPTEWSGKLVTDMIHWFWERKNFFLGLWGMFTFGPVGAMVGWGIGKVFDFFTGKGAKTKAELRAKQNRERLKKLTDAQIAYEDITLANIETYSDMQVHLRRRVRDLQTGGKAFIDKLVEDKIFSEDIKLKDSYKAFITQVDEGTMKILEDRISRSGGKYADAIKTILHSGAKEQGFTGEQQKQMKKEWIKKKIAEINKKHRSVLTPFAVQAEAKKIFGENYAYGQNNDFFRKWEIIEGYELSPEGNKEFKTWLDKQQNLSTMGVIGAGKFIAEGDKITSQIRAFAKKGKLNITDLAKLGKNITQLESIVKDIRNPKIKAAAQVAIDGWKSTYLAHAFSVKYIGERNVEKNIYSGKTQDEKFTNVMKLLDKKNITEDTLGLQVKNMFLSNVETRNKLIKDLVVQYGPKAYKVIKNKIKNFKKVYQDKAKTAYNRSLIEKQKLDVALTHVFTERGKTAQGILAVSEFNRLKKMGPTEAIKFINELKRSKDPSRKNLGIALGQSYKAFSKNVVFDEITGEKMKVSDYMRTYDYSNKKAMSNVIKQANKQADAALKMSEESKSVLSKAATALKKSIDKITESQDYNWIMAFTQTVKENSEKQIKAAKESTSNLKTHMEKMYDESRKHAMKIYQNKIDNSKNISTQKSSVINSSNSSVNSGGGGNNVDMEQNQMSGHRAYNKLNMTMKSGKSNG